jgi:hypothetical protein
MKGEMKYKLLIFIFLLLFFSCVDTHKKLFVAEVSIKELKQMLTNQTCHNKAIFIFDPACPTCMFYLQNEYPIMQNRFQDSIDYVFISMDVIPLEKYKQFFHSIGINAGHLLFLREKNIAYWQENGKFNMSKIVQYWFSNKESIYIKGFPVSAMTNKENKLQLEYFLMDDSTSIIQPRPWHRLDSLSLDKIDFNTIENLTPNPH